MIILQRGWPLKEGKNLRYLKLFLIAVVLFGTFSVAPVAKADKICDIPWWKGPIASKKFIGCIFNHVGANTSKGLYIAHRESRYDPYVCNASNHCGYFQIYPPLWDHMIHTYVYGKSLGPLSRTNGRAAAVLTARFTKHEGWWPWE